MNIAHLISAVLQTWGKLFLKEIHHQQWRSVRKIIGVVHGWPYSKTPQSYIQSEQDNLLYIVSPCKVTHLCPQVLISWFGYGGKMSDLVVAMLQLTGSSTRDGPAKSLAVRFGALGGGVFSQTFSNQLPQTNQVTISDLQRRNTHKKNSVVAAHLSCIAINAKLFCAAHRGMFMKIVGAYLQLLLQTIQGLWYFVSVLRVVFFLGLITQQSHGKQRWLQIKREDILKNQKLSTQAPGLSEKTSPENMKPSDNSLRWPTLYLSCFVYRVKLLAKWSCWIELIFWT